MKKFGILVAVFFVVFAFLFSYEAECRPKGNVYEILQGKEIKTYVENIKDSSGDAGTMLKPIKKILEDALVTRMTLDFKLVSDPEDADIIISCDVTERIWLEVDPVDQVHGIGAAAMDVALKENYGRMQALFTVKKAKRNRILWKRKVQATITKGIMPEEESIPLLEERIVKVFFQKCFSKNSKPSR